MAGDTIVAVTAIRPEALISAGVLCFFGLTAYSCNQVGSNDPTPAAILWVVFGAGFLLTSKGLKDLKPRFARKPRIVLATSLFLFGIMSFVLAGAIAHAGFAFLYLAVPALYFGARVCLMD